MCTPTIRRGVDGIRVAQINAQRSVTVLVEIRKLIAEMNFDIICIQEPYSRSGEIPHMPTSARVIKEGAMPMAVIVVVNKDLKILKVSQFCNDHTVCIEVTSWNKTWMLVNSYFQFAEDLDLGLFRKVAEAYSDLPTIYMADANAKSPWWFNRFRDQKGEIVEEFISEFNLAIENQPLNPPTFINRAGASSNIDVTLANMSAHETIVDWKVGDGLTTSDHNLIYFDLLWRRDVSESDSIKIKHFNFKKADWEKLKLNFMVPTEVLVSDDIDRKARELTVAIRAAMKHSIPTVTSVSRDEYKPWSDHLQKLRGKVRRARRIYQRTRVELERRRYLDMYRNLKREFKEELRKKRLDTWQDFVESNLALDAWGVPYRLVMNKIRRPDVLSTLRKRDGSMTGGWEESAKFLMDELLPSDDLRTENEEQRTLRRQMTDETDLRGVVYPFSIEETIQAIREQKPKKAAGPDTIKSEVLHHLVMELAPFMTKLYNECLVQGRIPKCFKEANVVILSKGEDRDPKLAKSYRPICLLNTLGKIQERLLCKRLREHRMMHGMASNQFGFRKGKSTEDAINYALEAVQVSNQKYLVGIFIDIAGAFDNLWWPFLFSCLRRMECPRSLYLSLLDYCKDRKVKLFENSKITKHINKGCPQGSILGPEFWDVGLEPLLHLLDNVDFIKLTVAYADDLLLLIEGSSREQLERRCSLAMEILDNWCSTAKLKIAASKTTYMLLRGSMRRNPIIKIGTDSIRRQKTTRYLGVHIDERCNFASHVEEVRTKAERAMMKLTRIGQRRFYLPLRIVTLYHNSILSSMVGYAAGVWASRARHTNIRDKLRRTQRKILLRFVGAFGTTPTMALLVVLGVWPLDLQVRLRGACYWYKKKQSSKVEQIVGGPVAVRSDIRKLLLKEWQHEWDSSERGRRTHEIFPDIKRRLRLKHLQPGRGLVQFITGHGPYGKYLKRFGQKEVSTCDTCEIEDTPEHALFECIGRFAGNVDARVRLSDHTIRHILEDEILWKDLDEWSGAFSRAAYEDYKANRNHHNVTINETPNLRRSTRLQMRNAPDDPGQEDIESRDRTNFEGETINRRRIYVQSQGRVVAARRRRTRH